MTNICLNGLNNIAPTELKKSHIQISIMILLLRSLSFANDKQSIIWFVGFWMKIISSTKMYLNKFDDESLTQRRNKK